MKNPNLLYRLSFPSLAIITGLGAVGCSAAGRNSANNTQPTVSSNSSENLPFKIYYDSDGIRELVPRYASQNGQDMPTLIEYCDGPDLLTFSSLDFPQYGALAGGSVDRSANNPACTDGQLTPEDFTTQSH